MLMKRLMIGLCGGTGSGKTTLARKIYNSLGSENAVLIGMDSYYKANWDIPYEQRIKTNYDHPNAFDTELMVHHLKDLKEAKTYFVRCMTSRSINAGVTNIRASKANR